MHWADWGLHLVGGLVVDGIYTVLLNDSVSHTLSLYWKLKLLLFNNYYKVIWGNSVKTYFIAVYFQQLVTDKGLT